MWMSFTPRLRRSVSAAIAWKAHNRLHRRYIATRADCGIGTDAGQRLVAYLASARCDTLLAGCAIAKAAAALRKSRWENSSCIFLSTKRFILDEFENARLRESRNEAFLSSDCKRNSDGENQCCYRDDRLADRPGFDRLGNAHIEILLHQPEAAVVNVGK